MFYKLLGMLVWKVAKLVLRRRYGSTYVPKPVLAGAGVVLALAVGAIARAVAGGSSASLDAG